MIYFKIQIQNSVFKAPGLRLHAGYARAGGLALHAFSAGGLTAAAALNERPDLFGAAVLRAPFVDLLTAMTNPALPLTVHEYDEWGNPNDNPEAMDVIRQVRR